MLSSGEQRRTTVQKYHPCFVEECMKNRKQNVLLLGKDAKSVEKKTTL